MTDRDFSEGWRDTPYWWERTPPAAPSGATPPPRADVLVIGSGYTGLHAAIATARAGLHTVVLERGALGAGCSTRNGGQISTSVKPPFAVLARRYGEAAATRLIADGRASLAYVERFVADAGIDCDHATVGRFHAAHTPRAWRRLVESNASVGGADEPHDHVRLVPRERQREELGSDAYHGGLVLPQHASVDPGRYHAGSVEVARSAGVTLIDRCEATRLEPLGTDPARGHRVHTALGTIEARRTIVATNGYTGALTPWLQRRVVPIGSYIIATEPLPADLMRRLMPTRRILSDTRRLVYYYRPSPDGTRILFGGRVSLAETDHRISGSRLLAELRRLFPELGDTRVTHSWSGTVAYTFDTLAHVGRHEGVHHALGYCGSGVGMAGFSGDTIGRAAAAELRPARDGDARAAPAAMTLLDLPFPTRPAYRGTPWFLAPSVAAYRWLDRFGL